MAGHTHPLGLLCFDLDGTLADTEPLHKRAKMRLVAQLGYREKLCYDDFVGKPNKLFWQPILEALAPEGETAQTLEEKQYALILQMAEEDGLAPSADLLRLLDHIARLGIPMAVCSSSNRSYVAKMLALLGLAHRFDAILGGDDVPRKKPAPDIYQKALGLFGVPGAGALAIEDSASGIASAVAAGMPCIAYRNPTSGRQDLSRAVLTVDRLGDIIPRIDERMCPEGPEKQEV